MQCGTSTVDNGNGRASQQFECVERYVCKILVGYDSLGVKKFSHALVGACFLTLPSATIRLNRCGKTALKPYGGCSDKIFKQLRNSCLGNFECIAFQEYNASGRLL